MNAHDTDTEQQRPLDLIAVEDSAIDTKLARFYRIAVGRELTRVELKRQVNALSRELGRAPPFALGFADTPGEGGQQ